jgi:inorganic triphosphatase YgiF
MTPMASEIELKLALPEASQQSFLRQALLKEAAARQTGRLVNVYYDTPDLALRRLGIALRLRRQRGNWLQTVKCSGQSAGGLTTRPEWEKPYQGRFDFSAVDDATVRAKLERPKTLSRLVPIFETSFLRTVWHFDGMLLMLDRGWIASAGRREAISEVEIEVTDGSVTAVLALAERLAERLPLAPALLSKAERGYRLHQASPIAPVKALPLPAEIAQLAPLAAFRAIAFSCIEHLQLNRDGTVGSENPEYIHQMRVATRRLRASIRLFAPLLPTSFTEAILPPLRSLMGLLGRVRDLDVLLEETVAPVSAALPAEPRLVAIAGIITDRRFHARADAVHLLESRKYGQAALRITASLHALEADNNATATATLEQFAATRLKRLRRKVRRLASEAKLDDPASLHAVRIGVKRLRYALEFFTPLAQGKARRRLAERLAEVQTTLGQLNDLANAGRLLMDCAGEDLRLREAVTLIGGWHGPRHAALIAQLPPLLDELTRLPRLS